MTDRFITLEEFRELYDGISEPKAKEIWSRPDFPVCDYSRPRKALLSAVLAYFQKPVKQSQFRR